MVPLKGVQSLAMIARGADTAQGADGIPLATLPPDVADTVVAALALGSLWRLCFCLVGALVLLRCRGLVPLMFALLALNYLASQAILLFTPLLRVGDPVGPRVTFTLFLLMIAGFFWSLRRTAPTPPGGADAR